MDMVSAAVALCSSTPGDTYNAVVVAPRHQIELKWRASRISEGREVQVLINGKDLYDLVLEWESVVAAHAGEPSLAGAYAGIQAFQVDDLLEAWTGSDEPRNMLAGYSLEGDKVAVLTCGHCGEIGCWPLIARVELSENRVTWRDFEQPHRRHDELADRPAILAGSQPRRDDWSYEGFGPFEFDREAYITAIAVLIQTPSD